MYLLISIVLSTIIYFIIFTLVDSVVIVIISLGVFVGCLIRAIFLLTDIKNRISKIVPKTDSIQGAIDSYVEEKNN